MLGLIINEVLGLTIGVDRWIGLVNGCASLGQVAERSVVIVLSFIVEVWLVDREVHIADRFGSLDLFLL